MPLSCGVKCAKFLLFAFNVVLWLAGVVLIVSSVYFMFRRDLPFLNSEVMGPDQSLNFVLYAMCVLGIFTFVVGFAGCCGAIRESKCLLGTYILLVLLIVIIEAAIVVVCFLKKSEVVDKSSDLMKKLMEKYDAKNETTLDKAVDSIQRDLKCCGWKNYEDWKSTPWFKDSGGINEYPKSCTEADKYIGCAGKLKESIKKNLPIAIGICLGIALAEIIGIIFATCLCAAIRREEHEAPRYRA